MIHDLEEAFGHPTFNQTAVKMLFEHMNLVRENTTRAVSGLEAILHLIRSLKPDSMKHTIRVSAKYLNQQGDLTKAPGDKVKHPVNGVILSHSGLVQGVLVCMLLKLLK